ncbi:MAG: hypothetical protein QOF39_2468, partial [Frankiales bacterium]|nr:hypothetical protein [Frankiales bacterium]
MAPRTPTSSQATGEIRIDDARGAIKPYVPGLTGELL